MSEPRPPAFVDIDPRTGRCTPTSYDSMRASILGEFPVSEDVPDDIRQLLLTAVDYFALAYEQANMGRDHLYNPLTDDAFLKAIRALEVTLRRHLGRDSGTTLHQLIQQAINGGLLPTTDQHGLIWRMIREDRNDITHGEPEHRRYGMYAGRVISLLIDVINRMYRGGGRGGSTS